MTVTHKNIWFGTILIHVEKLCEKFFWVQVRTCGKSRFGTELWSDFWWENIFAPNLARWFEIRVQCDQMNEVRLTVRYSEVPRSRRIYKLLIDSLIVKQNKMKNWLEIKIFVKLSVSKNSIMTWNERTCKFDEIS